MKNLVINNTDELFELFNELEIDNNFYDLKIKNAYVWKIIRAAVYEMLQNKVFKTNSIDNFEKIDLSKNRISAFLNKTLIIFKHNAFKNKKQCRNIVIKHQRRIKSEGKLIEVNTAFLKGIIKDIDDNTEFLDINVDNTNTKIDDDFSIMCPTAFDTIFELIKPSNRLKIKKITEYINECIKKDLDINIDVKNILTLEYVRYATYYRLAKKYFELKKPERIYIVVAYCFPGIVQAAKDLGIEVIELQHGFITHLSPGYSFPNIKNVPHFPDKLFVYGDFWKNVASYPIDRNNIVAIGNPYYERQIKKFNDIKKENNSLLFISTEKFGKKLSKIAYAFAKDNPNYKIYYKLHPHEFGKWQSMYPEIDDKPDNFIVLESEINLYELFARSEYLVSVASTAIYESMYFKPKIILCNHPELERMKELTDIYKLPIIDNENELIDLINNNNYWIEIDRNDFYKEIEGLI